MARQIRMLCFDEAQILDIAGPLEVFSRTSRWMTDHRGAEPSYEVELVAINPGEIRMSSGLRMIAAEACEGPVDTLMVTGGIGALRAAEDEPTLDWLRRASGQARRVAGVCTGSLILASAGLLRGKKAATHWAYLDELQRREPTCLVDENSIYVRDENIFTSAGVTAGIDMALALVEEDHGRVIALHVAQELVMYLRRPGSQAQFSRHVRAELRDTPFAALEQWALEHLDADLSVEALAAQASMSRRHFIRRFKADIGETPASWVRTLRLEAARREVEQGAASLKAVARRFGFADEQSMRRAFRARLGVTPQEYRARFA